MKDRQPTRPGRVRITPENGEAYYAVMEMADEPTEVGTPPIKANLLKDSTAALLGGGADMVPDEALVALKNLIDGISPDKIGAARVVTGSFVGTGSTSSKTITAGFKPKAAIFANNDYGIFASGGNSAANVSGIAIWIEGITKINTGGYSYNDIYDTVNVTQTETGLILQNDDSNGIPNEKGVTYYYAIFG